MLYLNSARRYEIRKEKKILSVEASRIRSELAKTGRVSWFACIWCNLGEDHSKLVEANVVFAKKASVLATRVEDPETHAALLTIVRMSLSLA